MGNELYDSIKDSFSLKELSLQQVQPLTLAYIGDAAYEMVIRTIEISKGDRPIKKIHQNSVLLVKADTQSRMVDIMLPILTEEEEAVYKRGRNAKAETKAKNASIGDYRRATGFEALMGYLYLAGKTDRMVEIVKFCLDEMQKEDSKDGK